MADLKTKWNMETKKWEFPKKLTKEEKWQKVLEAHKEIVNDTIVCPHCFYENQDSWELALENGDNIEMACEKCDKEFAVTKEVITTYTTYKLIE